MSATAEQAAVDKVPAKRKPRFSLFTFILLALVLGVATGIFLGEHAGDLKVIGDAYVGLLQMTVLPYIVFSLIGNIGRLTLGESKRLATTALAVMLVIWGIGAAAIVLVSYALPNWATGAFFSTSFLEPQNKVDLLSLFIPANPFYSLANNLAPAVVVFCMLFGFALIKVKNKEALLNTFDLVNATLSSVTNLIVRLSPIGIFAISASATGTLTLQEFGRLQAYLLIFVGSVLMLTLWLLPMLVAACTPFKYRDIMLVSRSALLTGFVVGSVFVIIPLLIESIRELLDKYQADGVEMDGARTIAHPEFIIPLAYPFPHLGKIMTLLFVPFAAWFYGSPMVLGDYPVFLATGLFLSFGKVTVTIPFLLELQEIPSDIFQLFLMSSVVAGRFNDLLGSMNLLAFTAVTTCAMAGLIKVKRVTLLVALGVTLVVGGGLVVSTRTALNAWFKDDFSKDKVVSSMNLLQRQAPVVILEESAPNPMPLRPGQSRLERIRERGVIRVGYHPYNLPFSYYNAQDDLVGLDIDMMHRLARDLDVSIEFVPFSFATMAEQLAEDHFDLAVSGILATPARAEAMLLSEPYMNVTMAFAVRDHDRREFATIESIRGRSDLTIGVQVDSILESAIREFLPNARVVELWSDGQFFEGPPQYLDALVTSAEGGSAWTLLYPEFAVVNPLQRQVSVPLVYPLGGNDRKFDEFMEHWIELKQSNGTIRNLYDYWVLGRGAQPKQPRWSVIRNVLHWVE